jgi:hypothetical protein
MNRRHFLATLAATAAATRLARAESPAVALTIDATIPGPTIPADFLGLSYEAAQLANPAFFSAQNHALIDLYKGLSPSGNLRIGGGSSEFTTFSTADPVGPPPFEVFGPDTSKTVKKGTVTTALAIRNLRGFLDATNWSCLYGLNLGQGTKEDAVAEATAVQQILGPRLVAFQIGNEPDSFRNRYRPATYGPDDFMKEWNTFHDAIVAAVPNAKFAGPDISNKLTYLTAFAEQAHLHPDVILLSCHYYAMGPAGSPDATLAQLFDPDPKLTTMHLHNLPTVEAAIKTAKLPFRMSEGNSCWDGGKPGVSDTLASALWCAEAMLRFASYGWVGVNMHGGGNGFYTPIAGAPSTGLTKRPEYFGMQFGQHFTGATLLPATLTNPNPMLTAYAFDRKGKHEVALFNKQTVPVTVTLPGRIKPNAMLLTGPTLESKEGTTFTHTKLPAKATVTIPAHSAVIVELS